MNKNIYLPNYQKIRNKQRNTIEFEGFSYPLQSQFSVSLNEKSKLKCVRS